MLSDSDFDKYADVIQKVDNGMERVRMETEERIASLARSHDNGTPVYFEGHLPDSPAADCILIKRNGSICRAKVIGDAVDHD